MAILAEDQEQQSKKSAGGGGREGCHGNTSEQKSGIPKRESQEEETS